ncbi:MAG: DNA translocase FtsK [Brevinematales bacterium]|nr:DNA translocase FtsK [Brevinematales bacterium]
MRRVLGGVFIFLILSTMLTYAYYPFLLGFDNILSSILRRIVYNVRVLAGEENTLICMGLLILVFIPLLFKKPFYYFFKNLLGVELITISWLGIYGISNSNSKPYIIGMIPYDISNILLTSFGITLSYIILYLLFIVGILLTLTSYKSLSKILSLFLAGTITTLQRTYEFLKSIFEYTETPDFETSVSKNSSSKTSYSSKNTSYRTNTTRNKNEKFIEITEIDDEMENFKDYKPFSTFKNSLDNLEINSYNKYQHYQKPKYLLNNQEKLVIRDVEIISTNTNQDEDLEDTINTYNNKYHENNFKDIIDDISDVEENNTKDKYSKQSTTSMKEIFEEGLFTGNYPPPIELLDKPEIDTINSLEIQREIEETKKTIKDTFNEFKIEADIEGVVRGPVVTMYEVRPKPGTKITKIVNISDNLALNLATSRVRIVYPIPGKSVIGVEIPNKVRRTVKIREVLESKDYKETKAKLPLIIGVDIHGKPVVEDLTQMPHLLIAGSTGSGKSVYVNSIIAGLLFNKRPDELKFIMIDLKIVELKIYNGIPHLLTPVITTPSLAKAVLEWLVDEMQYRYKKLEYLGSRDIVQYNLKVSKLNDESLEKLPYIVLIIDEYADLMMTSPKETEDYITRLAAMSRAVGIHLIIATQRPSVDVVTGLIKANFPARVAFRVASKVDSRTILDTIGAEKLLGKGDLLFTSPSHPSLLRVQGCYISNEEVERVVNYLIQQDTPNYVDLSSFLEITSKDEELEDYDGEEFSDELYNEAIKIVVREKKASASYLQRRLRIGYNRAARMIERMEEEGIVGPQQGSKPREIFVDESYLERLE